MDTYTILKEYNMKSFIVLDLSTGAMDGFYTDKEGADMMLPFFNERHPGHMWVVVEVVTSVKGAHIPNDVFHTDKLGYGTHA